jgi:signal peptidase I
MVETIESNKKKSRSKKSEGWGETIRTIVYAVLIALVVRTFAVEPFNIPSGSMIPTLLIGDYLFVSKVSYGYSRYSFPFSAGGFDGRFFFTEPKRGDVAVFKYPGDQGEGMNRTDYVKRIIGLPGDRVQVTGGVLHINGVPVVREKIADGMAGGARIDTDGDTGTLYWETLPGGVRHLILEQSDDGPEDNTPEFVVPPGRYFMMGDNRDNSADSRTQLMLRDITGMPRMNSTLGWTVPAENLIGRAEFTFFSFDSHVAGWTEPWKWPMAIRYGRLLKGIR